MFRLKSSPAKLPSFHQKQETDGRAQLQKVLRLLWKSCPGACSMQGRRHSTAVLHRAAAPSTHGPTAHAAHGDAVSDKNPPGIACSSLCCTPVCAHGQLALEELKLVEEKCFKDCLVFVQYAGGPVPVRLPLYLHQKHLVASGPC